MKELTLISVQDAANRLGMSKEMVRAALIQKKVPFGFAIEKEGDGKIRYRYFVFRERLIAYIEASDMDCSK